MDTTLLVNINGAFQRLDIFQDIPITFTIQQSDLTDLTSRRVPYSKTFELPDTADNAIILEHYFEINGIDFNPLNKVQCVVQYRGTDIFTGILRLNSVSETRNSRVYEVYILGEVADFASQLQNLTLQDLAYTDLNHQYSYSAITQSWEANGDGVNGLLGGKILYPLINYGLDYQGQASGGTPTFTYSFDEPTSFDQPANAVPIKMFKPAIQLKDVVDRVFSATNFTYTSEFFNTDYFKAIYFDTFQNGQIGIQTASASTNQNIFLTGTLRDGTITNLYRQNTILELPLFDALPGCYDPLNNWDNVSENGGYFRVPYNGDYAFNLRFGFLLLDATMIQGNFNIIVKSSQDPTDIINGTTIYTSPTYSLPGQLTQLNVNEFWNLTLTAGQCLKIYVQQNVPYIPLGISNQARQWKLLPFNDGVVQDRFIRYELYSSPSLAGQELVNMKLGMPNFNCLELLKSLITMFNLVVIQDNETRSIRIEPYTWYYNDEDREVKDFTNILDTDLVYKKEPLSFDLKKELNWTHQNGVNEYLPKLFFDQNTFVFGREKFTSLNNVFVGEQTYSLPFGSTPTSGITNGPNFIIPKFYYEINNQQSPYATIPHIFFWTGNRYAYKDALKQTEGYWYLFSGSTAVQWKTYPAVSHLSLLDSSFSEIVSDLNFLSTFDYFGNSNTQIAQFTPYTLFNVFWEDYIINIYSPETRRFTGKFFFRPIDVYDTKLNDKIWLKDASYTIERITDANLTNKVNTEISLIKNISPYYKITPPAPIYFLEPNQAYPGFDPQYTTLCFVSTTSSLVCNSTAPLEQVITFGNGTIENFKAVWYDNGVSVQPYPVGTFIKQQNVINGQTFVVIDATGRILEFNNC
jgi:hypothetical protein